MARLVAAAPAQSHWAVDAWTPAHSGCRLAADATGRIIGQEIYRGRTAGPTPGLWKSAGMLKLSPAGAAVLAECLAAEAADGRRNIYYDDVVGKHVGRFDLHILDLAGAAWVEIDDLDDMAQARRLFDRGV